MKSVRTWVHAVRLLLALGLAVSYAVLGESAPVAAYTVAETPQCPSKYTLDRQIPAHRPGGQYYAFGYSPLLGPVLRKLP